MSNCPATVSENLDVATATPSIFFLVSVTIILREYIKDLIFVVLGFLPIITWNRFFEVKKLERILIVEDDVIIGGGVKFFLEKKGYEVILAESIKAAKSELQNPFNLILLDINLPDGDGFDFCREIRHTAIHAPSGPENSFAVSQSIPIIFLTANDTEENMIAGFKLGCDDYISKPFSVEILYHRIAAVLKRTHSEQLTDVFNYRDISVDFSRMQVSILNKPIKLSATEFKLLKLLIKNRGQVLTRNQILEKIWDCNENYVDENTLSVHIRRLRQKIESDAKSPEYIITVFGIGYTFGEIE